MERDAASDGCRKGQQLMASGYFPLNKFNCPDLRERIKVVVGLLDDIVTSSWELAHDNDQFDNAASDGSFVTYLSLAKELIQRTIEKDGS